MTAAQDRARELLAVPMTDIPFTPDDLSDVVIECRPPMRDMLAERDKPAQGRHGAASSRVGPDGAATLSHEDLLLVLGALRTAMEVAPTATRYELAALAYRLGDDR